MNPIISSIVQRKANTIFVVLFRNEKDHLDLVKAPGENKPWSSTLKPLADQVAKEFHGEARTIAEAFDLLQKENPNFEKHLIERVQQQINPQS